MKNTTNRTITSITFLINPLLSCPMLFIELINRKKYAIFLVSLFLGMLGYITIPLHNDDLTRHYANFQLVGDLSFPDFLVFLLTKPDFLMYTVMYSFSKIGLSKQFLPLLAVFFGYYYKLKILDNYTRENKQLSKKVFVYFLLIFFLSIDFRSLTLGIRNSTAIIFFIYGTYKYLIQQNKNGLFYIAIAPVIHTMVFLLLPLVFLAKRIDRPNLYRNLFLFSFLFYLINIEFIISYGVNHVTSFLGPVYQQLATTYTEGYWGSEYLEDKSFKGQIAEKLLQIPTFVSFAYLFLIKRTSHYRNLAYLVGILANLLFSFPNLFGRYGGALTIVVSVLFLIEYSNSSSLKMMNRFLIIFLLAFLFKTMTMVYTMRHSMLRSYPKMVYQTSLSVFSNKVEESDYIYK